MKGLCVRQPWATLIASGRKTIELRTWRSHYRGPLIVIASATPDRHPLRSEAVAMIGIRDADLPRGVALALVELVDVRPFEDADETLALWHPGKRSCFSWLLRWVRALDEPRVSIPGFLGVRDLPRAAVRDLRRTIDGRSPVGHRRAS
jgi:hypothetical protein